MGIKQTEIRYTVSSRNGNAAHLIKKDDRLIVAQYKSFTPQDMSEIMKFIAENNISHIDFMENEQ